MNPRRDRRVQEIPERPQPPPMQAVPVMVVRDRDRQDDPDLTDKINALSFCLGTLVTVGSYPFRMTTLLVQMGYEPYYVHQGTNLLGKQSYLLMNKLQYANYIRRVDGLFGCYRGFTPHIVHQLLFSVIEEKLSDEVREYVKPLLEDVRERLQVQSEQMAHRLAESTDRLAAGDAGVNVETQREDNINLEVLRKEGHAILLKCLFWQVVRDASARIGATVVCYPLRTLCCLAVSEFVGRDGIMSKGFFSGVWYIYKTRGIKAFYGGLVPRIMGESISICLLGVISYILRAHFYYLPSKLSSGLYCIFSILTSAMVYPFQVVSTCMAVSQAGFRYGSPPFMVSYKDWRQCWNYLAGINMLSRGYNPFWRCWTGPLTENGAIIPQLGATIGPDFTKGFPNPELARL